MQYPAAMECQRYVKQPHPAWSLVDVKYET